MRLRLNQLAMLATTCGALFLCIMPAQAAMTVYAVEEPSAGGDDAESAQKSFSGNVSWYGPGFQGKKTASGKPFDTNKLTCAHRTLPFGTKIQIENPRTGKSVIVEVIDRGPYAKRRVLDLSREAARRLGILLGGTAYVNCLILNASAHMPELNWNPSVLIAEADPDF